jgi:enoyl-CoA hydratase
MTDQILEYEVLGQVAIITMNRPEARNAVNGEMAEAIEAAVDRLEGDDSVWVAVLAGNGPVFCAGADLKAIAGGEGASLMTPRGGFAGFVKRERTKPVIAAVDGPALAGGTEIALACDLVVASVSASFGIPEVKRSLIAAAGGLFRLPRVLPRNIAMELALTGEPITAGRAKELGLVNRLVEPGEARSEAIALAQVIAGNAPVAVRQSRRVVLAAQSSDDEALWQLTSEAQSIAVASEDFQEGPRAFIEKRPPQWTGR